jgi:hypothetical protein
MRRFRAHRTIAPRYDDMEVAGLPKAAMVLSNSERREAWCSRKWMFSYGRLLGTKPSLPMQWGSFMHAILEDIYTHWALTRSKEANSTYSENDLLICNDAGHTAAVFKFGCSRCNNTNMGPIARIRAEVQQDPDYWESQAEKYGGMEALIKSLYDSALGYLEMYGKEGPKDYDVVGVEMPMALPVRNPDTGDIYVSAVPVVETSQGWRLAGFREKEPWKMVRLPWYQTCRLDSVLQHKRTKDIYALEFKTSANPTSYGKDLHLDNQIPGYLLALEHNWLTNAKVKGYIWDVISSRKQAEPKILKSGKLSTEKSQRCPSWKYKQAIEDLCSQGEGMSYEDLHGAKEILSLLATTADPKLYHREWGAPGKEVLDRYRWELLIDATRFAKMRRSLVTAETEAGVLSAFPRVPYCRGPGGGCSYAGICMEGGESLDHTIASFDTMPNSAFTKRESVVWLHKEANNTQKEEPTCPIF